MEKHGSESYDVEGEGCSQRAPTAGTPRRRRSRRPGGLRSFASLAWAQGVNRRSVTPASRRSRTRMVRAGRCGADPGRVHLPTASSSITTDLRQDKRDLGDRVRRPAAAGPFAQLDLANSTGPDPRSESAKFYEVDGIHLKMGKTKPQGGFPAMDGFDLPRAPGKRPRRSAGDHPRQAQRQKLAVATDHLA